jgi:hypothetical protein
MDEQTRRARELDALEIIAAELAKLRVLVPIMAVRPPARYGSPC